MSHAVALAKGLDPKLCLVRVSRGDNMSESEREELDLLANQIRSEGVADVECKILYGDPSRAIVDLTYEYPDALVAMTTHGRSGMSRWLMGSVADTVVRQAAGPVLVLRG